MEDAPASRREATETYIVKTYGVSRHQARRLMRRFGDRKSEIDRLLGARGRTRQQRRQDTERTLSQVSFG